ncbi:hypothetical protein ITJ86_07545 [Winogradskyella sp. F6397]|uniref:Uncharacterized protein n=1 Tax=Winogradskyella marina TaxID=2785530 RepID=A0ABS0EH32_9FLAO|nr:hypothetical protein [Winogradskyella marina]MBF8149749.1 hypothetical protein [Winogradskyella marina]
MKKTRKHRLSSDYFIEALYGKTKAFLLTNMPSKLATLKVLAIMAWFKDIN